MLHSLYTHFLLAINFTNSTNCKNYKGKSPRNGHLDSWDVGTEALDDGGGVAVTVQTLRVIKQLELKPKRTLRAVFWAAEEEIYIGAKAYYEKHKGESSNISW